MRRFTLMTAALALTVSAHAHALGSLARVSVVDRDSGATLPTYYSRGEYWVAGDPGARYAIEIRNASGGRVLAVTSVDGVNVLSGDTAAFDQAGYVFDPGECYQIAGWRKSNTEVAAFTFTDARDSYAGRTGRPANIGVIGVALFREQPQPVYTAPKVAPRPAPQPAPGDSPGMANPLGADAALAESAAAPVRAPAPAARLGTGHGEREYSSVVDTEFHRQQAQPNEIIRIRYDSYENLLAMGIIRKPHAPRGTPEPFPNSAQRHFVPDPPPS
ncbi:MAG TPA: hypothetical protein VMU44_09980 [Steroidobacteraceae bacterium]|nr:hypothetical protein [Steroidobacteraceae bacterium]